MDAQPIGQLDRARRLERGLIRVRWFGVILGLYLVSQSNTGLPPFASSTVVAIAYGVIGALALGNLLLWIGVERADSADALRRLGRAAFVFDAAILFALTWAYSYDPRGPTWVIIYILPLEGALRYRLEGAMLSVGVTLVFEIAREAYLHDRFPGYPFLVSNVAFRVGIQAIVAFVAGFMARSLAHQADRAEEGARRAGEAARRESAARRELAAFNTAILTGVAAEDLDTSIQLMAGAIGRDLEFETFTIMLKEGDELVVRGMYGMPFYQERIPVGRGVSGTVAETKRAMIVPDVTVHENYIMVDPEIRSEMAAPMRIGEEVIGVLDVESRTSDAFGEAALNVLIRLADQIALVAHSNRLLSQQRETVQRLQELDQMKSDFVAITSHELRTPITAIRGFVKTLLRNRDRLDGDEVTSLMGIIDRQSARLARLVDDLLFISKIEAGTIRLSPKEFRLADFLGETVENLDPGGRARLHLSAEPADAAVRSDPDRLDQVLRNLVENALKFSSPDSPVDVVATARDGRFQVAVTDRGVGIAPPDLTTIFDRFHQVGHVLTRETEGAGLGLYIVKRLVEAMGGTISVTSTPGEGSTFRIDLPDGGTQDDPAAPPTERMEPSAPRGL